MFLLEINQIFCRELEEIKLEEIRISNLKIYMQLSNDNQI